MPYTRTWSVTEPADTDQVGLGAQDNREALVDIGERLLDDGVHLPDLGGDPINLPVDGCCIYGKNDGADEEVHIMDSAGNIMQLSRSGTLLVSGCRVYRTANQPLPSGAATRIQFDGITFDARGEYVNPTFAADLDGYYVVTIVVASAGAVTGETRLYINGVQYSYTQGYYSISQIRHQDLVLLTAADTVEGYAYQNSGGAITMLADYTYMTIEKVG